ncbi:MAG TPA: DUF1015 domain-containing protein [Candidatus Binatia bacterium]|nr:DUF1015 domain-containing protein [Candidatus Binatia bacterium]
MAEVRPFPAVRYDPARVGDLRDVIAPPYDVISPAEQEALYARSPWNVVRLILGREPDRAAEASRTLRAWMDARVLRRDAAPALYRYAQTYVTSDGVRRCRDGVLCRLRLEPFSRGVVRPHERTFPGPKADRLAVLRATGAHLSPIFGLYGRPGERVADVLGAAAAGVPEVEISDDAGHGHRLWRVTDAAAIARFAAALAGDTILIADGHHRYETALAYRDEQRGAGATAYVLAFLANMEEEGLVILPTHRLVRGPLRLDAGALEARLRACGRVEPLPAGAARPAGAIDVVLPERRLRVHPGEAARAALGGLPAAVRALDVAVLHGAILEPLLGVAPSDLAFTHDDAEAVAAVETGRAAAAFLLNPPSMAAVRAVCLAGELMPEKSTYFYPKLASGLVFDLVGPPWI